MERTLSVEEKIRKAEQISARRRGIDTKGNKIDDINKSNNDIKLLKKMIIQIIISLLIYLFIYIIQNSNYVFSQELIKKVDNFLTYDTNFMQLYENIKKGINKVQNNFEKNEEQKSNQEEEVIENNTNEEEKEQENIENSELSQEEKDIEAIKSKLSFIKPLEGIITSRYGQRAPTTLTVPKNHTGIDIASDIGTKIKSATDGEVVLVSEEGDYGNHVKIQNGEISIVYAHCNNIYVKQGEQIIQGQEIAEVGSTGNSTGPHLHFEIRISERTVDPEKIWE